MANDDAELLALGAVSADDQEDKELLALGATPDVEASTSALRGAEQGLTMDWADELGSAFGAALESGSNVIQERSLAPLSDQRVMDLYDEYLNFNRKRYKEAQAANPGTYFGGQIAGGALLPIGSIGQAGKAASLGQKVVSGATAGGAIGGLQAAGASEAKAGSKDFIGDTVLGAQGGLMLGALVPPTVVATKAAADEAGGALKWTGGKLFGPVGEAYSMGKEGIKATTEAGQKAVMKEAGRFAGSVGGNIEKQITDLAKRKNEILREAQEAGVQLDPERIDKMFERVMKDQSPSNLDIVERDFNELRAIIKNAKEGKLVQRKTESVLPTGKDKMAQLEELRIAEQSAIESGVDPSDIETIFEPSDTPGDVIAVIRQRIYRKGEDGEPIAAGFKKLNSKRIKENEIPQVRSMMSIGREGDRNLQNPVEMYQLYKDLKQKSQFGDYSLKSQEGKNAAGQVMSEIQDILKNPKAGIGALTPVDEGIASLNKAAEAIGIKDTREINQPQIRDKILSLLGQEGEVGIGGIKAQERIDDFLLQLEKVNKPMADQLKSEFKRQGSRVSTLQEINKPLNPLAILTGPLGLTRQLGTGAANVAGYTVGKAANAVKNIGEAGVAQLHNLTPEWAANTAQALASKSSPVAKELSNILVKAANSEDRARNAVLFGLMQNPAYRQYLTKEGLLEQPEQVK